MMHVFVNDATLNVRIGRKTSVHIATAVRIYQRERLFALLFTVYLTFVVKPLPLRTDKLTTRKHCGRP